MCFFSDGRKPPKTVVHKKLCLLHSSFFSKMPREGLRSARARTQPTQPPSSTTPTETAQASDGQPMLGSRVVREEVPAQQPDQAPEGPPPHEAVKGDRYLIPSSTFFDDGDSETLLFAVVTRRRGGKTSMWFEGDTAESWYDGNLEEWTDHFVPSCDD